MLNVDTFFHYALAQNEDVMALTEGRIFNPACKEKDLEGPFPYVIVRLKSIGNAGGTKDGIMCPLESGVVEILAVGADREGVAELTEAVHAAITEFADEGEPLDEWPYVITTIRPSADEVVYDDLFDCCAQTLTYVCDVETK